MKIAITATAQSLDAQVDSRFGRCPYYLIVETEDLSFTALANPGVSQGSGAGIQAAQFLADKGVQHILTGNCGPKAHQTLAAAGISVSVGCSGTVREAVEQFKTGKLPAASGPSVGGHFGTGSGGGRGRRAGRQ